MSQENVEVVRRATAPYNGQDAVQVVRKMFAEVDWSGRDAVEAALAGDEEGRYLDPDIEWDHTPVTDGPVHGLYAVARFWADWVLDWETYLYRIDEYCDLGNWVLTPTRAEAVARGGLPVAMTVFQLWQVTDGKITVMRAFLSEEEALEAAGLRE